MNLGDLGPEALAAIAARHGVPVAAVRPMPAGVANRVYALGPGLVLRVPRTPAFVSDLRTEAAVIPLARRLGIRTPAVVDHDDSRSIIGLPYMVLERAPGRDLAERDLPPVPARALLHEVGRQLAVLHRGTSSLGGDRPDVPTAEETGDPGAVVAELLDVGRIDPGAAEWLTGWFERLAPYRPSVPERVLVHGDLSPQNLLVTESGELGGVVDWGDAAWADPASDFAKLPLAAVPAVLDGYRREVPDGDGAQPWEARVLWYHLAWALARLRDPVPVPGRRHWTAPPLSRLVDILRFFAGPTPEPWRALVPPAAYSRTS
jgi:hygromycin-B 7''-O-kinase